MAYLGGVWIHVSRAPLQNRATDPAGVLALRGVTMRVNVYAEEMTDRIEIISKEIDGHKFTGLRFYLELPVTVQGNQIKGPFVHRPGDDDSSAVTFWGKQDLRKQLLQAIDLLDNYYGMRYTS